MVDDQEETKRIPAEAGAHPSVLTNAPFAFPREQEYLLHAERVHQQEDISLDELRKEFGNLISEYRTLVTQTAKLTRISDSAQKRLLRSQEARIKAEKKYRSIYEQMYEGLFQLNEAGEFVEANPAMAHLLGYEDSSAMLSDLKGRSASIYCQPGRLETLMTVAQEMGMVANEVSQVKTQDGNLLWVSQNIRAIQGEGDDSANLHFEGSMVDVTTKLLAEDALKRAKSAAEEANRSKDQFIANMSHELRTPLNGIMGYAQLLLADDDLETDKESGLRIIQSSAEHLLGLINELLDLAKVQANKIELYATDFDMQLFLETVVGQFADRAAMKGLQLNTDIDPHLPANVNGDEQKLRQVIFNLLANAIKFTDKGDVTLSIKCREGDRIQFAVQDSGIGISKEDQPKLFVPFEQVGDKSRYSQGTGLGLAISYSLVELMGGMLEVSSDKGQGSCFYFEVPLPAAQGVAKQITVSGIPDGYHGETRSVLIVDDDGTNRKVLRALLERASFSADIAEDAEQAIAKAQARPYDCYCLDITMPGTDGFELVAALRKLHGDSPVYLAVTANATTESIERVLNSGFDAFILKPFRVEDLFRTIADTLQLEWKYNKVQADVDKINLPNEMVLPEKEHLEALLALAKKGQVRKLKAEADSLLDADKQYHTFASKMLTMLSAYQTKALRDFLEDSLS